MAPTKDVNDTEAQQLIPKDKADEAPETSLRMYLAAFSAVWLVLGVLVGTQVENWSLVTSLYVFVQIITTIGYGDVTVDSQQMKTFMTFYVLVSVMLIAGFMSDLAQSFMDSEGVAFIDTLKGVEDKVNGKEEQKQQISPETLSVIKAGAGFAFFVIFGTVFYGTVEYCSCSFGATAVEGCIEGPRCENTGGKIMLWTDAFYMSVITLTTVGFGDHSPSSQLGRSFGCLWMLFGVVASANFVTTFGKAFLTAKKDQRIGKVSEELFKKIDMDGSGHLSKNEFRMFALQKWGLLTPEQLEAVDSLFTQMDRTGDGFVDFDEICKNCQD